MRIVPANARSIDDDGPVAMVSFPPGRRVKSTGALFVARLTKTLSVPASVNPSIPTSAAEPLPLSAKKLFVGVGAISRISASPNWTFVSWTPSSCGPTPANTVPPLTPILSSDTRTVVGEPAGVTKRSSPRSKTNVPLA